jgi:membrane-bound serine protease (ClpP class)
MTNFLQGKGYLIHAVLTTLVEEAVLILAVSLGLPLLGINVPSWGLVLLIIALASYAFISYRIGQRTLRKKARVGIEALIGVCGQSTSPLNPEGYIRIQGELWKARATTHINEDEEVIVTGKDNLILLVSSAKRETDSV